MKIVSQLNHLGYFVAPVEADESPLEPGIYLIPGGAIDVPPPDVPSGKVALWQGGGWWFVAPPSGEDSPPIDGVPQVVTRFQARAALARAGLFMTVNAAMKELPEDDEQLLAWEDAQEFRRNSPTLLAMAAALDLSETQLDDLFTVAAGIEA